MQPFGELAHRLGPRWPKPRIRFCAEPEAADIVLAMTSGMGFLSSRAAGKRILHRTAIVFGLFLAAAAPSAWSQTQSGSPQPAAAALPALATAQGHRLTFDVASVRPSSPSLGLKGLDFLDPVSNAPPPAGGLISWNVQIVWLIDFAYDLRGSLLRQEAFDGLPKPMRSMAAGWYTIEARAEGNPTREDIRQMVRSLLEDRFQYSAHLEKRDGQIYALEVARPGLGLKPHPEGTPCTLSSAQVDENSYPHAYPAYKGFPARCGIFNRELSHAGERRLEMLDVTMQQITDSVGLYLQLMVVDRTGLQGHYDAVLDFTPGYVGLGPDPGDALGVPMLPTALEKQLGLKLEKQNAQVDVFVTDHMGTLTEN